MKTVYFLAETTALEEPKQAPATTAPAPSLPSTPAHSGPPGMQGQPPPLIWSPFRSHLGAPTEILILLIVVLGLAIALFGWALIFRKPSKSFLAGRGGGVLYEGNNKASSGKRRRRSQHPENRPRNPTLKERGGLPPIRDENPPNGQAPAGNSGA